MSREQQEATPLAQDHIAALIRAIPKKMLQQTQTRTHRKGCRAECHIRPTILADFLRQDPESRKRKTTIGMRAHVDSDGIVFEVQGYALAEMSRLQLPTYNTGIGRYVFVNSSNQPMLRGLVPHETFRHMLCEVYGVTITYSIPTAVTFAEYLSTDPVSWDTSTKRRIRRAHQEARQDH